MILTENTAVSTREVGKGPTRPSKMKSPSYRPTINRCLAHWGVRPRHASGRDSTVVLQGALAGYLHHQDIAVERRTGLCQALGQLSLSLTRTGTSNMGARLSARQDSIWGRNLRSLRSEAVSHWFASRYPARRSPIVFLGATNGAAVHLASALGVPWLPQNFLTLVRAPKNSCEDAARSIELAKRWARELLEAAPELELHQVQNPVLGELTSREVLYFRFKRLTLGKAYERFLLQHLETGGTIVVVDCQHKRPCLEVGNRHFFELPKSNTDGSSRPSALPTEGAGKSRSLHVASMRAEAEWGYAPELTSDALRFADRYGYRIARLTFDHPEHLSSWVADLYREQVLQAIPSADRLVVEPFCLADPWCVRRTGSVPFWTAYNDVESANTVAAYLDSRPPFAEVRSLPLSGGVQAPNTVDDLGACSRYHEILERLPDAPVRPQPLHWRDVLSHAEVKGAHPVRIEYLDG